MRRTLLILGVIGMALALLAPAAGAATPYCGITWGSLPKGDFSQGSLGDTLRVRAGRHECFDRLVVDVSGDEPGYHVMYMDEVRTDGAGIPVPLRGGAFLEIVVTNPTQGGLPVPDVSRFTTFRQVADAGSFEGNTTVGLGVRARLPFRVFTLDGPGTGGSRLVIDVAHRW
jgi:hypothetical protein